MEILVNPETDLRGIVPAALVVHEDEHLLVIRKPPGINTHAAAPYAGEGIYDWLRRRTPRWAQLAIVQRLDKETSGVLLFSKSRRGNVSLTKQFSRRRVQKEYVFLSHRELPGTPTVVRSRIRKGRGRFESDQDEGDEGDGLESETRITCVGPRDGAWEYRAEPLTGRTHQIRLHAADAGIPILGDAMYGGRPAGRLCLHARVLRLRHPATNEPLEFVVEPDFALPVRQALRKAVIDPELTTAFRVLHGASDGCPGWYVERWGDFVVASAAPGIPEPEPGWLEGLPADWGARGLYVRVLERHVRDAAPEQVAPAHRTGAQAGGEFVVRENGLAYRVSLEEGYSTGLFLDQRDNRRRLLSGWVGPEFPLYARETDREVLNVFAYTCGFSVAAAAGGARTTSLDLSRRYLDWGRRNLAENGFDPAGHDFIYGDAQDWLRRLLKKGRGYDVVILDPPTFSQSREHGVFRVERDYAALVEAGTRLLRPGGVLLASTNTARLAADEFLARVREGVGAAGRIIQRELFVPQPPDFPTSREEPGYLKTAWLRLDG